MGILMEHNSSDTVRLVELAQAGDVQALNELFARHRERLRRMVQMVENTGLCLSTRWIPIT
jgi:hypothetical protein